MQTYPDVLAEVFGSDLKHYYPLDAKNPLKDMVGSNDAVSKGTGATWSEKGVRLGKDCWLEIPDHRDFSVATTGELGIIYEMTVHSWTEGFANGEYTHPVGKGDTGGTGGNHEWTFRIYKKDGSGEAATRKDRTSFYVFNPEGKLGAGSYVQENLFRTDARLIVGGSKISADKVMIRVDGAGDADPLSGYNVKPVDRPAPVRVGRRDATTGYAVATFKRMAFVSRMPTVAEVEKIRAARLLPDYPALPVEPPEPVPSDPLYAEGLNDVVAKHNALVDLIRLSAQIKNL